ncbi:MAG: Holliday junction branch migration DNA helicase RuvB [Candidatus Magasanikbacteria bacterium]|jgi:holliday junction DNA helicase RuvB|nr:Holliday junction branch migration DNA helicase RuvB [Candidatus Magasanikbacteria bacterium]MBT5262848.1 Holliday junction branch migration DNA helicase RuvB [Candidatus Magasanikbacteria bacterium]MBT5820378.1 Holliday junction branch migration DNA helicase RuvB [Candidatus Magasanikbacteria bacterium]MBT6294777.1 Holliday junction branch migration DNA helicase RuvB [Candidatus Magasanikbacteria bacterium]
MQKQEPPTTTDELARIVDPEQEPEETILEVPLRPTSLSDFIGQGHIKEPLSISIEAAAKRNESLEHVLFYGNPGLGKTTLANIIASEMNTTIQTTAGPALERAGDLAAILSNLNKGDILFIDEIHRINKTIEEVLYTAMEDYAIDIIVGKGPAARTLRMPVERFTLIGATTKLNLLSGPFRDRFGHVYHLNFYTNNDIEKIIQRNAILLDIVIQDKAEADIASRARRTPRIANRLLKRVRDYTQVRANGIITPETATTALNMLHVDIHGLDQVDRKILTTIIETFKGGPVGLSTLAAAVAEDIETLETIYEPYLLQIGMLERTPRGRKVTSLAVSHISQ